LQTGIRKGTLSDEIRPIIRRWQDKPCSNVGNVGGQSSA
jgi:hypothetical protein